MRAAEEMGGGRLRAVSTGGVLTGSPVCSPGANLPTS